MKGSTDQRGFDRTLDPENYDGEITCKCGRHQGECDGPPARCCEACIHWEPEPLIEEEE